MKQQELDKILDAHELWLKDNKKGKRADLSTLYLRGLDFSRRKLNHIILSGADCTDARFVKTDLSFADFTRAIFIETNLRFANCTSAIFHETRLIRPDCTGVDFTGTTLTRAFLEGLTLTNAKLAKPIVQIGGIGSRKDYIVYHVADDLVQCSECSQWIRVSLEDFIVLINEEVCPETITESDVLKYRSEYLAAIEYFKIMRNNYLKEC